MKNVNALVTVALVIGCGTVQAGLINPGFEDDTNKWIAHLSEGNDNVGIYTNPAVLPEHTSEKNPLLGGSGQYLPPDDPDYPYIYKPQEGQNFLMIGSGFAPLDIWQSVTQEFEVIVAGEKLSGNAAFDWDDSRPGYDQARVSIFRGWATNETLFDTPFDTPFDWSGQKFPKLPTINYANGTWIQWTSEALPAGTYTIEYAVRNTGNNRNNSFGYFDAVSAVPEPTTLVLFAIGIASLSSMQRRRTVSLSRTS